MATTTNFTCNKDARVAQSGGTNMGSGTSDGLPYGTYSGYKYRTLLGFSINMAGWTSITKAELYVKSSNQIHIAFGSDPTFVVHRIQAAWSEGSSSGLSTSNAVVYGGPSAAAANAIQKDAPTAENTWAAVDITAMMRDVLGGAPFYGLRLIGTDNSSNESGSAANVGEIYSRESGSGTAYIKITYETNRAPDAPTVASTDVVNGLSGKDNPTLNVTMTDPDGNAINNYRWQIDDNSDFSSPIQDVTVGSGGANGFTAPVVPAALARGGTYYFRAQAADVSVWGGWSTTFQFKIASLPTLTVSEPSASGRLVRLQYDAGSGWGSPRAVINWAMTCPDGGTQATWRLEFYGDAAGAPSGLIEDITVNDTQSARVVPYNLIEGNYYNVRVTATCSHGLTSQVGFFRVRARWGVGIYQGDMGATAIGSLALTTLDATDETNGGAGRVVLEYQTTTTAGIPGSWVNSVGAAGLNRYFWYRVWLLTWGASPTVSPTLNNLAITYSTSTIVPDKWQITDSANQAGDASSYVYGTKSLRLKGRGIGNGHAVQQVISVVPDTNYIVSGRVQTQGAAQGRIDLLIGGVSVATTPSQVADIEFEDPRSRLATGIWNSGSNTQVTLRCISEGPVGTTVWFDAIKMEASTVVTPWSPGYVANAVVLDAGGISIDGSQGGIFRLKAGSGGARDLVELGGRGLMFGDGTSELYSGGSSMLNMTSHLTIAGFLSAGGTLNGQGVNSGGPIVGPYNLAASSAGGAMHNTGAADSGGKWAKMASGNIPGQYWSHQMHGFIHTRYGISEIAFVVQADAGPAAQPTIVGTIRPIADYAQQSISRAVVVVKSLNPIVWELYVQAPGGYAFIDWFPDSLSGEGSYPVIENPANYAWFAALPAGVQTSLNIVSPVRFQMGSTTRNIAAANGTAQGVVTFPVAFQNTPFVWAYANAAAGNAAYVTIQSVSTASFDLGLKAVTAFNYTVVWMAISPAGYNA